MLRIEMANLKSKREEEIIDRIDWISSKEQVADIFTKEKVPNMCVENLKRMVNDFNGEERERENMFRLILVRSVSVNLLTSC